MADGEQAKVVLLLLALFVAGFFIFFNIFPASMMNLGLSSVHSLLTGFFFVLVKLVALGLMILPVYVIVNMIRG